MGATAQVSGFCGYCGAWRRIWWVLRRTSKDFMGATAQIEDSVGATSHIDRGIAIARRRGTMRVISIRQPWATLVALGAKRRETRSWPTRYRGQIAIHASAGMPTRSKEACSLPLVKDILTRAGYKSWRDLPRGVILAVGTITDVQEISPANTPPSPEFDFGDYTPGRFQWFLSDVRLLANPIPAKGSLGLWRTDLLDDQEIQ